MRKYALTSIVLAMLIAAMDSMILTTVLPHIVGQLGGIELFAWVTAAFLIMNTVSAPLFGKLADVYGRKNTFGVSILFFLLGSMLCGASHSMLFLVIARGVQGIGAGGMMPLSAIIAGDLFTVENRGKIQALFTSMWGISSVLGPLVGGLLVHYMSWRWIFYINIPIAIVILLFLSKYKDVHEARPQRIDYLGAVLFTAGVSSLLAVTVVEGQQTVIATIVLGIILLILFAFHSKKTASPFIPFRLFRNRVISSLNVSGFLVCAALFGASQFIPLFLQRVIHMSMVMSGLVFIGQTIGWMVAAVPAGKWIIHFGYRAPMIVGTVVLAISGFMLTLLSTVTGFWYVTITFTLQGFAFGLLMTVATIGSQEAVQGHLKGLSTSIGAFSRNIGTSVGVTVMGAILANASSLMSGIHALYMYGFIVSIIALFSVFFVPQRIGELGSDTL